MSGGFYKPKPYPGPGYSESGHGTIDASQKVATLPEPPRVRGGGSGEISVDTTALKIFSDNLDTIAEAIGTARTRLDQLRPLRAGGDKFVEAQNLDNKITGNSGGGGLTQNYLASMHALRQALMDTAEGIRNIARNYSTIEQVNEKAGSDLTQLLQRAQSDIMSLESMTGGSAPAPTATTGAGGTPGTTTTTA